MVVDFQSTTEQLVLEELFFNFTKFCYKPQILNWWCARTAIY